MNPTIRESPRRSPECCAPQLVRDSVGQQVAVYVVALSGLLGLAACTNIVIPPPAAPEPQVVFVLDHGRHASLVLPAVEGGVVRYTYGDWNYYARGEAGVLEATGAAVWPTTAGLGRRQLQTPGTSTGVRAAVLVGIEHLHEVTVAMQAIHRLRARLDTIYRTNIATLRYNPAYDLEFVQHPATYTIVHNSNRVVAGWLRELDCQVTGLLLLSRWQVQRSAEP